MSGATVSVTFDNLGEVTALARGEWPPDEPLGRHFSVTRALPRILEALDASGLRATFFVEGLNAELYPDTLRALAAAGHEVAYHGWCHEQWAELEPARERALLERGVRSLEALGLRPAGFRPPGGELTAASPGLLRALGFTYASPAAARSGPAAEGKGATAGRDEATAGDAVESVDGLALLPFRWPLVDAVHYLPRFAALRRRELGAAEPLPPARLRATLARALDAAARDEGFVALLFHPFLAADGERFDVLRGALERARALVDAGALQCAPCREVAATVRA